MTNGQFQTARSPLCLTLGSGSCRMWLGVQALAHDLTAVGAGVAPVQPVKVRSAAYLVDSSRAALSAIEVDFVWAGSKQEQEVVETASPASQVTPDQIRKQDYDDSMHVAATTRAY